MVPAAFVVLAALPLTPNRKVDRKALPVPEPERVTSGAATGAAPAGEIERMLATVWQELLGRERVGIDDNFFDLGGHSLLVVRMHRVLQQKLDRPIALTDLYRFPTIRSFAVFLSPANEAVGSAPGGATGDGDGKKAAARGAKRRELLQRRGVGA
jgi:hypothetical protein